MTLEEKISEFPHQPGVYLMKDQLQRVIYVGKAIDLKKRVQSYFRDQNERYQIKFLMSRVTSIDCIVTDSEKEALLLENTLIKKHRPRYNIQLRDDKSYVSIKLSMTDRFPRLYVTRQIKKDGSLYFGPFVSAGPIREIVDTIEKFFRLRNCSDHEFANRVRPCLQHQIHRCDAPCVGLVDEETYAGVVNQVKLFLQGKKQDLLKILKREMESLAVAEEYEKAAKVRDLVGSIEMALEKQKVDRHNWLNQDVIGFYREGEKVTFCFLSIREGKMCENKTFYLRGHEEDAELIESFLQQRYQVGVADHFFVPDEILVPLTFPNQELLEQVLSEAADQKVHILTPQRGDKKDLVDLALKNAQDGFKRREKKDEEVQETLAVLQEKIGLQNFPHRMECFDISNTSGEQSVGSMVCFVEGLPYKEGYRKFKIKTIEGPNDFHMMKEVLSRRFLREKTNDPKWVKPDLIVIDGGKGQLNIVQAVMEELQVTGVDLISLAKEKEGETQDKVFLPGRKNPILLGRHSNVLHLLMRLRDEAHRFAITYHKKLRSQKFLPIRVG